MNLKQAKALRKLIYGEDGSSRERVYRYYAPTKQRVCVGPRRWYQASKRGTRSYKLGNLQVEN